MHEHAIDGSASGSTNPLIDDHAICALVLVVVAATGSSAWGLGSWWNRLPLVGQHRWMS